ncbi:EF-Hand 1, calcium-binding site-containing protein [Cynara cardunculus var. scolymus]|uniref:EF-Hand 1, calcium-binding site-containing protein n=1 Tax=Cynara cardunculus var. scolymus TaxID=59895 RepID=A0A103YD49_CYNCS|nr:EF-Hand 1, calcium-binding site-containing protein [Cynara cardunculus var. scolymus]
MVYTVLKTVVPSLCSGGNSVTIVWEGITVSFSNTVVVPSGFWSACEKGVALVGGVGYVSERPLMRRPPRPFFSATLGLGRLDFRRDGVTGVAGRGVSFCRWWVMAVEATTLAGVSRGCEGFFFLFKEKGRRKVSSQFGLSISTSLFEKPVTLPEHVRGECHHEQRPNDPLKKYAMITKGEQNVKNSSFRSNDGDGSRKVSAHEIHYTANRAVAEEMRRKTFLPYKSGLLGCLGFHHNLHEVSRGR